MAVAHFLTRHGGGKDSQPRHFSSVFSKVSMAPCAGLGAQSSGLWAFPFIRVQEANALPSSVVVHGRCALSLKGQLCFSSCTIDRLADAKQIFCDVHLPALSQRSLDFVTVPHVAVVVMTI